MNIFGETTNNNHDGNVIIDGNISLNKTKIFSSSPNEISLFLPPTLGLGNQFLSTDGQGHTSWAGVSSIPGANDWNLGGNQLTAQSFLGSATPFLIDIGTNSIPMITLPQDASSVEINKELKLKNSLSQTVSLKPPLSLTSYSLTFPSNPPTASTILMSDSFGVLSWQPSAADPLNLKQGGNSFGVPLTLGTLDGQNIKLSISNTLVADFTPTSSDFQGDISVNGSAKLISNGINFTSLSSSLNLTSDYSIILPPALPQTDEVMKFSSITGEMEWFDPMPPRNTKQLSTGLLTGGVISINLLDNTLYQVTAGTAVHVEEATGKTTDVSWAQQTLGAPVGGYQGTESHVLVDKNGGFYLSPTHPSPTILRDFIHLGELFHANQVNLDSIVVHPGLATSGTSQLHDLMTGVGKLNISGNIISSNSLLTIARSSGQIFSQGINYMNDVKNPHIRTTPTFDTNLPTDTFKYVYQDGSTSAAISSVIPAEYDNGNGVLTPGVVGVNKWQTQRIYLYPDGALVIQPGQVLSNNKATALRTITTETYITEGFISKNAILIGYLVLRGNAINLNSTRAVFLSASKFGNLPSGNSTITTLQDAYLTSLTNPEILTDDSQGPINFRRGTTGGDTDIVFDVQSLSGVSNFQVNGLGQISTSSGVVFGGVKISGSTLTPYTITLPQNVGGVGQILKTIDASGGLSWVNESVGGSTLQSLYDSSVPPQISLTTNGALSLKAGVSNTGNALEVQNTAGINTFSIDGNGLVTTTKISLNGLMIESAANTIPYSVILPQFPGVSGNILKLVDGVGNLGWFPEELKLVSDAQGNTLAGSNVAINLTSGLNNCIYGNNAADALTTGSNNVLIGTNAGDGLTTQSFTTFLGTEAGRYCNVADTVAIGYKALRGSITTPATGLNNLAIGCNALTASSTGFDNIGIGSKAGLTLTTAQQCVFIGATAGQNCNADFNLGIGTAALKGALAPVTGTHNIALGYNAGRDMIGGFFNTLVGAQAGRGLTSGSQNVFIGLNSGIFASSAINNIAIGTNVLNAMTGGSNNVAIGEGCAVEFKLDNIVSIGRSSHEFGTGLNNTSLGYQSQQGVLGVTTNTDCTSVGFSSLKQITTGSRNVSIGDNSLLSLTTGSCSVAIGSGANQTATTSSGGISIGCDSSVVTDGISIGQNAATTGVNAISIGKNCTNPNPNTIRLGNLAMSCVEKFPGSICDLGASGNEWNNGLFSGAVSTGSVLYHKAKINQALTFTATISLLNIDVSANSLLHMVGLGGISTPSLLDATEGHQLSIVYISESASGDGIQLSPNSKPFLYSYIEFSSVGDTAQLIFTSGSWQIMGLFGAVLV